MSSLQSLIVSTSQTVTIPANVSMMWMQAVGAGSGANGAQGGGGSQGFAGGSAGETGHRLCIPVTGGGSLVIVIGAGGAGATGPVGVPGPGTDTTVAGFIFKGGTARTTWTSNGNFGGGPRGFGMPDMPAEANAQGGRESVTHYGGTGTLNQGTLRIDGVGNGADVGGIGNLNGRSGGGAGAYWPKGGNSGDNNVNGSAATGYGAGGGGGGGGAAGTTGGVGSAGVVILFWIA